MANWSPLTFLMAVVNFSFAALQRHDFEWVSEENFWGCELPTAA